MNLSSFRVRGFKNLKQEVKLEALGPINVIHGPNNVGKSNLLQSMEFYFRLLGFEIEGWIPIATARHLSDSDFEELRFDRADIFNLESPTSIEMSAEIETDEGELERAGIRPLLPVKKVNIELVLQWVGTYVAYRVRRFIFADGTDAASVQASPEKKTFVLRFAKFLMQNFLIRTGKADRFALIGVNRLSNPELALALYDAKESADIEQARRWERFVEVMASFRDILGEGSFVVTYDRRAEEANLFYQTALARIPLRLLGSGVQQVVSLIGHLLMTNATLVAIEEPELNLRYSLQERLREVLESKVVGSVGGPSQLFITSHSPAFESGQHFYWMEPTPGGPKVEKRKVEEARLAVGFPEEVVPPGMDAARCYLSTEGVVRVPEHVRQALGLPHGGGVMFLERGGHVEMMSDEQFAAMLDADQDGEGHGQA